MPVLRASEKGFEASLRAFIGNGEASEDVRAAVTAIVADVKRRGDAAVLYHTAKFDHAKLNVRQLRVPAAQIEQAAARLDPAKRKAFAEAAKCIEDFHRRTLPKGWTAKNPHGATVGERYHAIRRCGPLHPGWPGAARVHGADDRPARKGRRRARAVRLHAAPGGR